MNRPLLFALSCLFATAAGAQTPQPCNDPFAGTTPAFPLAGWETDFCRHSVPYTDITSGGPPRDGIPPIDAPRFVSPTAADAWIADREPVLFLQIGNDARAYPLQILTWHEIVNDTVGGEPVAVTFCPLCYAALVYKRPEIDGRRLTFGTTGNLRHSDLIMWDRQTESWWQQFSGEAIVGKLLGTQLEAVPASLISWNTFKASHPEGKVLARDTVNPRPYGRNPYVGYDDVDQRPWLYDGPVGKRLRPMEHVVGLDLPAGSKAYPRKLLRKKKLLNDTIASVPVVVFWDDDTASALDTEAIAKGRDIGSAGAFRRAVNGRVLTFHRKRGKFRDKETGSTWSLLGKAVAGPLKGTQLKPVVHHNVFWFVWSAFKPEGTLYQE